VILACHALLEVLAYCRFEPNAQLVAWCFWFCLPSASSLSDPLALKVLAFAHHYFRAQVLRQPAGGDNIAFARSPFICLTLGIIAWGTGLAGSCLWALARR
jgi:hypothetical protein